jgi:ABC-type transporter MlaC component
MSSTALRALALVAAIASSPQARAAGPSAADRTQALIAAFKKLKPEATAPGPADEAANASVFREIDGFIDFETLTSAPVAPRAAKFSADQMAAFRAKFKQLIRLSAYQSSGALFREARITLLPQRAVAGVSAVPLKASFPEKHTEVVIEFRWTRRAGTLKLVDLLFDGDSTVTQYQRRLSRLIDKHGVAGMMAALDQRAESLTLGRK